VSRHHARRSNLYLAGFMGSGKSTVGKELARLMGRRFVDMDVLMERAFDAPVARIFALHGEEVFRREEKRIALELAAASNQVVATGGGTLLDDEVFQAFSHSGLLICLYASRDHLVSRLQRTDRRPLITARGEQSLDERVGDLLEERHDIYQRITIRVDTSDLSPREAARKIVDLLIKRQKVLDQLQNQYIDIS